MKPNYLGMLRVFIHEKILCPFGIHDFGDTGMFDCFYCDKDNPPENWPK